MKRVKSRIVQFLLVVTAVSAVIQPIVSSASPLSCKTLGSIRILKTGNFKCSRIGNNRLWRKINAPYRPTSSTVTSSTTTTLPYGYIAPTCGAGLLDCPPINQEIASIDICKVQDATPGDISQGFPRPRFAKPGKSIVNILFVPARFGTSSLDETSVKKEYATTFEKTQKFFAKNSYKRVTPVFVLEPQDQWIQIEQTYTEFSDSRGRNLTRITQDLVSKIPRRSLQEFDSIFIIGPGEPEVAGGMEGSSTYTHGSEVISSVYLSIGPTPVGAELAHGLGHSLYYFEDLYLHPLFRIPTSPDYWPMRHDIMSDGDDYSGWNRWLAGFLSDSEILCLSPSTSDATIHLSYLNAASGKRLAVIPQGFGRAIFLEHIDFALHAYELNSFVGHGAGPLRTIGTAGVGKGLSSGSFDFTVVSADSDGLFVRIKKRDL